MISCVSETQTSLREVEGIHRFPLYVFSGIVFLCFVIIFLLSFCSQWLGEKGLTRRAKHVERCAAKGLGLAQRIRAEVANERRV